MSTMSTPDSYNRWYAASDKGKISRQLFKEVYRDDYPSDEVGGFDFLSMGELRRMAGDLRVGLGQTFVDLACGAGGPGLWIARETGAGLVGIDFSTEAIKQAEKRAVQFGLEERARYQVADIAVTGLPEASFDGGVSIDALWCAPDKVAVLHEVGRILRLGARFVFTTWEDRRTALDIQDTSSGKIYDYRPLLCDAGFDVESYEETHDWEQRQRGVYLAVLAHSRELIQEMGEQPASPLIEEAKFCTELHDGKDILMEIRRILVVARRLQ